MTPKVQNVLAAVVIGLFAGAIGYLILHNPVPVQAPAKANPVPRAAVSQATQPDPAEAMPVNEPAPAAAPEPAELAPGLPEPAEPKVAAPSVSPEVAALQRQIDLYQQKLAKYRAGQPVFLDYLKLLDEFLLPMAKRGTEASVVPPTGPLRGRPIEDPQKVVAAYLGPVAAGALQLVEAGQLAPEESGSTQLRELVAEAAGADGQPLENPYEPGSADYNNYDVRVSVVAVTAARSLFFDVLQYASPELEGERDFLADEIERVSAAHPECSELDVDADPYEDLVRERLTYLGDLSTWSAKAQGNSQ